MYVSTHLDMTQSDTAAVRTRAVDSSGVSRAVLDRPDDGEYRALVARRIANGVDLLVVRGEEDRRLDLVYRVRAER